MVGKRPKERDVLRRCHAATILPHQKERRKKPIILEISSESSYLATVSNRNFLNKAFLMLQTCSAGMGISCPAFFVPHEHGKVTDNVLESSTPLC